MKTFFSNFRPRTSVDFFMSPEEFFLDPPEEPEYPPTVEEENARLLIDMVKNEWGIFVIDKVYILK